MLLELRNVHVKYGTAEAIKGVNINVDKGSIVAIIGANGAGKSTILKAISGLVRISSGEIVFKNKRIDRYEIDDIVRLGLIHVPEGRRLFPHMSVLDNLKMGSYLRKDQANINKDLEKMFHFFPILWERRNQKARTLSGGEQEMLAIARGLMAKPEMLLLDEPSFGLSPIVSNELVKIIKQINQDGITILLVEQNADLVLETANRGYVIDVGEIVLEGDIKELIANKSVQRAFFGE